MPVYLRRFYTHELISEKGKEKDAHEKAMKANSPKNPNEILANRFNPPKK